MLIQEIRFCPLIFRHFLCLLKKTPIRYIHIHDNTPGLLAQINTVFTKENVNIEGQYLKTNEQIGYVITDVNKNHNTDIIKSLTKIKGTIKVRVLY